ncbi:glycosyltransferase family 4 protein [Parabacteroides sp. APC149_11_2_Y6]
MFYALIFVLLFVVELIYFRIANRCNIIDKPNQRSSHTCITLRGGGIIFYIGILLYTIIYGFQYFWFFIGLTLIAGISFWDDVHSVPNRVRLIFHFMAMLLMFLQWGLFTGFPLWYILIALVFCTGIINAYNFMDGINGITGGYSLVVLVALVYINSQLVRFVQPEFVYVAILSVLVFNLFNFRTVAKCFAGDVGAVSIAFIILFLLGKLILQTGDLSYIILLSVYGVDSVFTITHRLMLRENIFEAHRKHAYQLMANELKIPHIVVSGFYMLLQMSITIIYLALPEYHSICLGGALLLLGGMYILFMNKYFVLHGA